MASDAIPLPKRGKSGRDGPPPGDDEIAARVGQATAELQDVMDAALLAGLVVEPSFTQVDNRLTRYGTRIDSFVCRVRVYRKLT